MLLFLVMGVVASAGIAPAEAAPARWWPTYDKNEGKERSYAVTAIQYLLRARGHKLNIDGLYGGRTENAVKAFQRTQKLTQTGAMNTPTWEALVIPLKQGSRGDAVRALQTLLRHEGYGVITDGVFGATTRAAVLKFQRQRGSTRDGIVGAFTWCELVDGSVGQMQEGC
jgi:peptidoglycan hydrolase-like protein with peptidoglycan-binding domain